MTAFIDHAKPTQAYSNTDGEGHDRCPVDNCIDVDRSFKSGGKDGNGEHHLSWEMFSADPRKGGCGTPWTRTTRQGQAADAVRGVQSRFLTRSAQAQRVTSLPSDTFQANYDRIDWER